jgi:hypothetical protein
MNTPPAFERRLAERLASIGPQDVPVEFVDAAIAASRGTRQRRPLIPLIDTRAWPPRAKMPAHAGTRRVLQVIVAVVLIVAMVAATISIGRSLLRPSYRNLFVRTEPIPGALRSVWPVAMSDGRVLVIGGWPGMSNTATNAASILDPDTGVFTPTGPMATEHDNGESVTLADGRVLVIAGMHNAVDPDSGNTPPMADVELFDPVAGTFRSTAPLSSPRTAMSVTRLTDGRVLVAGGRSCLGDPESCHGPEATAELFDPTTERWTMTGSVIEPFDVRSEALLPDGRVLLVEAGAVPPTGETEDPNDVGRARTQIYDPATGRFASTASSLSACGEPLLVPRHDRAPLLICTSVTYRIMRDAQGQPVLDHGSTQAELASSPSTVEAYDADHDRFTVVGTLPFPARTAAERLDGQIVVTGSTQGSLVPGRDEPWAGLFDAESGVTDPLPAPSRWLALPVVLPDGRVVLVGGDDPVTGEPTHDAEVLE